MRATRLQLQGFKSFAARTELDLSGGITAIVGPNGSGKSNLVDAIRLVLGGASARELRGQRLDHVIFSGGERRAPQGMAEVSIAFDNEDGRIPVEDTEVLLTRRVFRDGASEFRRNGSRVRMRDVGRLLESTGLTQAGYAIIAQNDIEAIIRANPAQRRHLIEEAAGIRGAQAMLDDGRQRLSSLDRWLEGSGGRLAELLPRIEALRGEADLAQQAAELQRRLRNLRGSMERAAWLAAVAEARRLDRQLQGARRRLEAAGEDLRRYEVGYRAKRLELERTEQGRLARQRRLADLALARQRLEAESALWSERALQAARDRHEAARLLGQALADLGALALPPHGVGGGEVALGPRAEELEGRQAAVRELEEELVRLRGALGGAEAEARRLAVAGSDAERRLERLMARSEAAAAELRSALEGAAEVAAEERTLREVMGTRQELRIAADRDAEAAGTVLESELAAETAARDLLAQLEAELAAAVGAERERSAAAAALEAQIAVAERGRPIADAAAAGGVHLRRLADAVAPLRAEDARAVDSALGALAKALVGEEAAARQALKRAGGVAELVAWPAPEPDPEAGQVEGCRRLLQVISAEAAEISLIRRCRPWTCLADDRAAASRWLRRWPLGVAALPDGTLVGNGWERSPGEGGAIGTRSQLRALQVEAARWVERVVVARTQVEWAAVQHQRGRERVDQARAEAARLRGAAASAGLSVERDEAAHLDLTRRRTSLQQAAERLRPVLAQLQGEITGAEREIAAAGRSVQELEGRVAETRRELDRLAVAHSAAAEGLAAVRAEVMRLEASRRARVEVEAELEERRRELEARRLGALGRIRAAEAAAVAALRSRARLGAELAATVAESEQVPAEGAAEMSDALQQLAELERGRAEVAAAETAAGVAAAELERSHRASLAVAARLEVEVGDGRGDEPPLEEWDDPQRAAAEIGRLERRLGQLGPVNELAPGQLRELLARTEGLRRAHDDVQVARGDLEAVGAALVKLTEARYRGTLDQVAREFQSGWAELFGGGRAALVSVPGEEGAMPGIDLEVQPRGKRVVPLALLSGGERALTALALVLALQQVAPSPLYVLDEVDAALDDGNVGSFARMLSQRSRSSQFVIVTHNLTTMAVADQLYGVTQDGRGSSRVISVRLAGDGSGLESAAEREAFVVG